MAEVVSIKDRKPVAQSAAPSQEVIGRAKQLLADARSGKITFLMWATVNRDEVISHGHVGDTTRHHAVAGAAYLQDLIMRSVMDRDD